MKKEKVFKFAQKVKLLLISLQDTEIKGSDYKIKKIETLYSEIEKELDNFLPNIEEEYSVKVKKAYLEMCTAKKEYENAKFEKNLDQIEAKKVYDEKVEIYLSLKKIRDTIKQESRK